MKSAVINPARFSGRKNLNTRLPVRIARLAAGNQEQLLAILCRLCADTRRDRFMACMTEPSLAAYVAAIDFRALADGAASTGAHRIIASCGARNRAMRELLRATDTVTDRQRARRGVRARIAGAELIAVESINAGEDDCLGVRPHHVARIYETKRRSGRHRLDQAQPWISLHQALLSA